MTPLKGRRKASDKSLRQFFHRPLSKYSDGERKEDCVRPSCGDSIYCVVGIRKAGRTTGSRRPKRKKVSFNERMGDRDGS